MFKLMQTHIHTDTHKMVAEVMQTHTHTQTEREREREQERERERQDGKMAARGDFLSLLHSRAETPGCDATEPSIYGGAWGLDRLIVLEKNYRVL